MKKIIIFGNSGSGKSTLAKKISADENIAHLDLDTLAFKKDSPTERRKINDSMQDIYNFLSNHNSWVIEGGYADLFERFIEHVNEIIFLDLSAELCQNNAKSREWEPHKYKSKEAQDNNLDMLLNWIINYYERSDTFSRASHQILFQNFSGLKTRLTKNT